MFCVHRLNVFCAYLTRVCAFAVLNACIYFAVCLFSVLCVTCFTGLCAYCLVVCVFSVVCSCLLCCVHLSGCVYVLIVLYVFAVFVWCVVGEEGKRQI